MSLAGNRVYKIDADYVPVAYVVIGTQRLGITPHTLERFSERLRPALEPEAALVDLLRMLTECTRWVYEAPVWMRGSEKVGERFLLVGDDILFPLFQNRIVSCVTRGSHTTSFKENRRAYRRQKASVRRMMKQDGRKVSTFRGRGVKLRRSDGRKPPREIYR